MAIKIELTEQEYVAGCEENLGYCVACGEESYECEPDARNYVCEYCGQRQVFGIEELCLMGLISFIEPVKWVKVRLHNTMVNGQRCGYGIGHTQEEAIEDALNIARDRDPNARYNKQTNEVCFASPAQLL